MKFEYEVPVPAKKEAPPSSKIEVSEKVYIPLSPTIVSKPIVRETPVPLTASEVDNCKYCVSCGKKAEYVGRVKGASVDTPVRPMCRACAGNWLNDAEKVVNCDQCGKPLDTKHDQKECLKAHLENFFWGGEFLDAREAGFCI